MAKLVKVEGLVERAVRVHLRHVRLVLEEVDGNGLVARLAIVDRLEVEGKWLARGNGCVLSRSADRAMYGRDYLALHEGGGQSSRLANKGGEGEGEDGELHRKR